MQMMGNQVSIQNIQYYGAVKDPEGSDWSYIAEHVPCHFITTLREESDWYYRLERVGKLFHAAIRVYNWVLLKRYDTIVIQQQPKGTVICLKLCSFLMIPWHIYAWRTASMGACSI